MHLSATSQRLGYSSRLKTDFVNTTGACLEVFYYITSELERAQLSVWTVSEELENSTKLEWTNSSGDDWRRLFARLPYGVNRVVIEGVRDYASESSIAIDDIIVQSCSKFGKLNRNRTQNLVRKSRIFRCSEGGIFATFL